MENKVDKSQIGDNVRVMRFENMHPKQHPFEGHPEHVDTIYYEDLNSYSIKLKEIPKTATKAKTRLDKIRLRATADVAIGITDENNDTYLQMPIYLGTSRTVQRLVLDTGSTHIAVAGNSAGSTGTTYVCSSSSSCTDGLLETLTYGSYSLVGNAATETVCAANAANQCVEKQTITTY